MGSGCLDLVFFDPILLDKSIFSSDAWLYSIYIFFKYLYILINIICFVSYIILYCIYIYIYISTPEFSKLVFKFVERNFYFPQVLARARIQ